MVPRWPTLWVCCRALRWALSNTLLNFTIKSFFILVSRTAKVNSPDSAGYSVQSALREKECCDLPDLLDTYFHFYYSRWPQLRALKAEELQLQEPGDFRPGLSKLSTPWPPLQPVSPHSSLCMVQDGMIFKKKMNKEHSLHSWHFSKTSLWYRKCPNWLSGVKQISFIVARGSKRSFTPLSDDSNNIVSKYHFIVHPLKIFVKVFLAEHFQWHSLLVILIRSHKRNGTDMDRFKLKPHRIFQMCLFVHSSGKNFKWQRWHLVIL